MAQTGSPFLSTDPMAGTPAPAKAAPFVSTDATAGTPAPAKASPFLSTDPTAGGLIVDRQFTVPGSVHVTNADGSRAMIVGPQGEIVDPARGPDGHVIPIQVDRQFTSGVKVTDATGHPVAVDALQPVTNAPSRLVGQLPAPPPPTAPSPLDDFWDPHAAREQVAKGWESFKAQVPKNIKNSLDLATDHPWVSPETQDAVSDMIEGSFAFAKPVFAAAMLAHPFIGSATYAASIVAARGAHAVVKASGGTDAAARLAANIASVAAAGVGSAEIRALGKAAVEAAVTSKVGQMGSAAVSEAAAATARQGRAISLAGKLSGFGQGDVPGFRATPYSNPAMTRPSAGPLEGTPEFEAAQQRARTAAGLEATAPRGPNVEATTEVSAPDGVKPAPPVLDPAAQAVRDQTQAPAVDPVAAAHGGVPVVTFGGFEKLTDDELTKMLGSQNAETRDGAAAEVQRRYGSTNTTATAPNVPTADPIATTHGGVPVPADTLEGLSDTDLWFARWHAHHDLEQADTPEAKATAQAALDRVNAEDTSRGPRWHPDSRYAFNEEGETDLQDTLALVRDEQRGALDNIRDLEAKIAAPENSAKGTKKEQTRIEAWQKELAAARDRYEGTYAELGSNTMGLDVDAFRAQVEKPQPPAQAAESSDGGGDVSDEEIAATGATPTEGTPKPVTVGRYRYTVSTSDPTKVYVTKLSKDGKRGVSEGTRDRWEMSVPSVLRIPRPTPEAPTAADVKVYETAVSQAVTIVRNAYAAQPLVTLRRELEELEQLADPESREADEFPAHFPYEAIDHVDAAVKHAGGTNRAAGALDDVIGKSITALGRLLQEREGQQRLFDPVAHKHGGVPVEPEPEIETRTLRDGLKAGDKVYYSYKGQELKGTITDPGDTGVRARIQQANGSYVDRWPSELRPINFKWGAGQAPRDVAEPTPGQHRDVEDVAGLENEYSQRAEADWIEARVADGYTESEAKNALAAAKAGGLDALDYDNLDDLHAALENMDVHAGAGPLQVGAGPALPAAGGGDKVDEPSDEEAAPRPERPVAGGRSAQPRDAERPAGRDRDEGAEGVAAEQPAPAEGVLPKPEQPTGGRNPRAGGRGTGARRRPAPTSGGQDAGTGRGVDEAGHVDTADLADDPAVAEADARGEAPRWFTVGAATDLTEGGWTRKLDDNLAALRLLKRLEQDQRPASDAEQAILARYIGWGHTELAPIVDVRGGDNLRDPRKIQAREELDGLLTKDELRELSESTANAHYSFAELPRAMWALVDRLGFKGGAILEPAVGTGHFLGTMPGPIRVARRTRVHAVDKEPIAAAITKQLYQGVYVQASPLEDAVLPTNYFDLVISNVPFGKIGVFDPAFVSSERSPLTKSIHNYYFAKALDLARPGGLLVFVTSRYTMDAKDDTTRRYIAKYGRFVGAFRLPDQAFRKTAGTDVVTDIIVIQKHAPGQSATAPAWMQSVQRDDLGKVWINGEGDTWVSTNEYFVAHPDHVLGTEDRSGKMTQVGHQYNVTGAIAPEQLAGAIAKFPQGIYKPAKGAPRKLAKPALQDSKQGAFVIEDGRLYTYDRGTLTPSPLKGPALARAKKFIPLRDAYQAVIDQMIANAPDADLLAAQKALALAYRAFVREFGNLNDTYNKRIIDDDPNASRVLALENIDIIKGEKGQRSTIKVTGLADVFTKRLMAPPTEPTEAGSASDALVQSIAWKGEVDLPYMESLTGKPPAVLAAELTDEIFQDPASQAWVARDAYLSGDVVTKLAQAEAAAASDTRFASNVAALRGAQPTPITIDDFTGDPASARTAPFGATWVPVPLIQQFLAANGGGAQIQVRLLNTNSKVTWYVDGWGRHEFLPSGYEFGRWAGEALNGDLPTIYNTDATGARVVDPEATERYRQSLGQLREQWASWWKGDRDAAEQLVGIYNAMFNRTVPRQFDGSRLILPNANPEIRLRLGQKTSVIGALQRGNTLLAQAVGWGKTYEMIAIVGEWKRLGLARKPLIVVPNHIVEQWRRDILKFYPAARVLLPEPRDFETANRKRLIGRIANNEWDAVVIGASQFLRVGIKLATLKAYVAEQENFLLAEGAAELGLSVDQFSAAVDDYGDDGGQKDNPIKARGTPRSVKDVARAILNLRKRLKKRTDQQGKDPINFEELGIDGLVVDEAHMFKNLYFYTGKNDVVGLKGSDADQAIDMYLKVRHINQQSNNRNVVFATGTPIANTMSELYTMFRYLAQSTLDRLGMAGFDSWANAYAEAVGSMEPSPEGGYKERTRLSQWTNLRELAHQFKEFADVITTEDILKENARLIAAGEPPLLKLPKVKKVTIQLEPHPEFDAFMADLKGRVAAIREGKPGIIGTRKDGRPKLDNFLTVTTSAGLAAVDMRLVRRQAADDPHGRLRVAAREIAKRYTASEAIKGTQIVFLDVGVPHGDQIPPLPASIAGGPTLEETDEGETPDTGAFVDAEAEGEAALDGLRAQAIDRNLYGELKRLLIEQGLKPDEIAFIHQAQNPSEQHRLFQAVKDGRVRVLLSTRAKGGTGMNVQDRVVALHHLDVPWRPDQMEQAEGRAVRQGNINEEVEILRYVTKKSFDEYRWYLLAKKQGFISKFYRGELGSMEDIDPTQLDMEVASALASGDPRVMQMIQAERALVGLRARYENFTRRRGQAERDHRQAEAIIDEFTPQVPAVRNLRDTLKAWRDAGRPVTIDKAPAKGYYSGGFEATKPRTFSLDSTEERKALKEALAPLLRVPAIRHAAIGDAGPFTLFRDTVESEVRFETDDNGRSHKVDSKQAGVVTVTVTYGTGKHEVERTLGATPEWNDEQPPDLTRSLDSKLDPTFADWRLKDVERNLRQATEERDAAARVLEKHFEQLDELEAKAKELRDLRVALGVEKAVAAADQQPGTEQAFEVDEGSPAGDDFARDLAELRHQSHGKTPEFARTETGNIRAGLGDEAAATRTMASSLYSKDVEETAPKELLQNAFDAVRSLGDDGQVTINFHNAEHWVEVTDNGPGMTRAQLETVFTNLFDSGKRDDAAATGGFGVAKASFLLGGEKATVSTVTATPGGWLSKPKRIRLSFTATPAELASKEGVAITEEEVGADTPTGTSVRTYVPKSTTFYSAVDFAKNIVKFSNRLPGTFGVTLYGKAVAASSPAWRKQHFNRYTKIELPVPGATVVAFVSPETEDSTYVEAGILNNGVFQFDHSISTMAPGTFHAPRLTVPKQVILDVKATVSEGDSAYPFTANREQLRDTFRTALRPVLYDAILKQIAQDATSLLQRTYDNLPTIPGMPGLVYLDVGKRLTPEEVKAFFTQPDVQRLVQTVAEQQRAVLAKLYPGEDHGVERVGILLDAANHGVWIPNPSAKLNADRNQPATILINPFEVAVGGASADEVAGLVAHTLVHEAVHVKESGHDEAFTSALAVASKKLGVRFEVKSRLAILQAYAEVDDPEGTDERINHGLRNVLDRYSEGRGRDVVEADALSRAGRHAHRHFDEPGQQGRDVRGARRSRTDAARHVTLDELRRLAEVKGTSIEVQKARARAAGYTVTGETRGPTAQVSFVPGAGAFAERDVVPGLAAAAKEVTEAHGAIRALWAPARVSESAETMSAVMRSQLGIRRQRDARARKAMRKLEVAWDRMPRAAQLAFAYAVDEGRIDDLPPDQRALAALFKGINDQKRREANALGGNVGQIKDYFPREWVKPGAVRKFIERALYGKRPLQGRAGFKKARARDKQTGEIFSFRHLHQAGFEPVSYNPVTAHLRKWTEMDKWIAARRILLLGKEHGVATFVRVGEKPREGETRYPESFGTVYGPPGVEVKEAYDKGLMEALHRFATEQGITMVRRINLGGKRWGYHVRKARGSEIHSRFGGPEGVLMHEIGHALDDSHNLGMLIGLAQRSERGEEINFNETPSKVLKELRALADLRLEKTSGPSYRRYVRQRDEVLANLVHGFLYAPDLTRQVAPNAYWALYNLAKDTPSLHGLLDIQKARSLRIGINTAMARIQGKVIKGYYYGPVDAVRLLENHLSPGLRGNLAFDLYRVAGNSLNQVQLGLSVFHVLTTATNSIISRGALALEAASRGHLLQAAKHATLAHTLIGPVILDVIHGDRALREFYARDAQFRDLVHTADIVTRGGGGVGWDTFWHSSGPERFLQAIRSAGAEAKAGNYPGALVRAGYAGWRTIPAAFELLAKPVMEWWVPRLKLAAYLDLARMELADLGPKPDPLEAAKVLGRAWDSIDNRFGELIYDNVFWNAVLKDAGMASVRSLGWNVGTVREVFGAIPGQAAQFGLLPGAGGGGGFGKPPLRLRHTRDEPNPAGGPPIAVYERGRAPWLTHPFAYFLALFYFAAIFGAMYQFLHTGLRPGETDTGETDPATLLLDLYFPRTGGTKRDGRPERASLWTYMKDVFAFTRHPIDTIAGKLNPALALAIDILRNEDYFGNAMRDADDPLVQQAADVFRYIAAQYVPISVKNYQERRAEKGESGISALESFLGINVAPQKVTRTPVEEYLHSIAPPLHKTKAEAETAAAKRDLRTAWKDSDTPAVQEAIARGGVTNRSVLAQARLTRMTSLQRAFSPATLEQGLTAYEMATPAERLELRLLLVEKFSRLYKAEPAARKTAIGERYQAAFTLPVARPAAAAAAR